MWRDMDYGCDGKALCCGTGGRHQKAARNLSLKRLLALHDQRPRPSHNRNAHLRARVTTSRNAFVLYSTVSFLKHGGGPVGPSLRQGRMAYPNSVLRR
jgi:hypothetical protein